MPFNPATLEPTDPRNPAYAWATQGAEDPTALNFPDTVEALLRAYGAEVLHTRAAWLGGTLPPEAAISAILAGAARLNAIFLGQAEGYRLQSWNSPAQLGEYLVATCHLTAAPEEAVEELAGRFAIHLIDVVGRGAAGDWSRHLVLEELRRVVGVFGDLLRGVPVTPSYATGEEPFPDAAHFIIPPTRG